MQWRLLRFQTAGFKFFGIEKVFYLYAILYSVSNCIWKDEVSSSAPYLFETQPCLNFHSKNLYTPLQSFQIWFLDKHTMNERAPSTPPRHSLASRVPMPRVGTKRYRGFASIAHYEASLHLQDSEDSGKSDPLQLPSRSTFEATPAKRRRMSATFRQWSRLW